MSKVKVYRFERYDINSDEWARSRRWATAEAIGRVCAQPVGDPVEVDQSVLGRQIEGMTERGFDPYAAVGFQQTVR